MNEELLFKLEEKIDKDFAWRIKEIINLKNLLDFDDNQDRMLYIRASILLLYAHWEGHVKQSVKLYIRYLKSSGFRYSDLKESFSYIGFAWEMRKGFSIEKHEYQKSSFEFFSNYLEAEFNADEDKIAITDSNLKYEVLKEIMCKVGLDYSSYELRQNFIDKSFLHARNAIAHGEYGSNDIYSRDFIAFFDDVVLLITDFNKLMKNSILEKNYLK